jgi:transglutaminase-like putative cysteine protease
MTKDVRADIETMRAADTDRQKVADQLKTALDEGRLTLHEYDERVGLAYASKTYQELLMLLTGLPRPGLSAHEVRSRHETPYGAAREIAETVGKAVEYVQGVTGVQTTAADAWSKKHGVCQDITHITLGALRAVGIPARYVSGYLHPRPDAPIGETVTGESHAWVEWFSGSWHGYDPTNLIEIGDRHVLVGRGRDYRDVAPLRGVYAGPFTSSLFVRVEITRES